MFRHVPRHVSGPPGLGMWLICTLMEYTLNETLIIFKSSKSRGNRWLLILKVGVTEDLLSLGPDLILKYFSFFRKKESALCLHRWWGDGWRVWYEKQRVTRYTINFNFYTTCKLCIITLLVIQIYEFVKSILNNSSRTDNQACLELPPFFVIVLVVYQI